VNPPGYSTTGNMGGIQCSVTVGLSTESDGTVYAAWESAEQPKGLTLR
jgi:hypothetical protein